MKNFIVSIVCLICFVFAMCGCASNDAATEEPAATASAEIASEEVDASGEASSEASNEASGEASAEAYVASPTSMNEVGLG